VIDSLGLGGAQQVLLQLLKNCDRERFAPEVAVLHGHGMFERDIRELDVPVHVLSPWRAVPLYIPNLFRLLVSRRYALVHLNLAGSVIIGAPLARMAGIPVRMSFEHSPRPFISETGLSPWLYQRAARSLTHATAAVSQSAAAELSLGLLRTVPVTRTVNGIDVKVFRPQPEKKIELRRQYGISEDARVVLVMGRLSTEKNLPLAIQIADELRRSIPNLLFLFVGEGPERQQIEELTRQLDLNSVIRFAGVVSCPEDFYALADAFLLTSTYEGTPLTVLEAMGCGLPVVASDVGCVSEIINHGQEGFVVTSPDPMQYARYLQRVLQDITFSKNITTAALAKVHANYSASAMTRSVEAVYAHVLH